MNMLISVYIGLSLNWSVDMKLGIMHRFSPKILEKKFLISSFINGVVFGLVPVILGDTGPIYEGYYCWVSLQNHHV